MARYTFEMAHLKAEQLRRVLNDAEDDYLFTLEKVLRREHFKDGCLNKNANLGNMSKLDLSVAFKRLQKAFIDYTIMCTLAHKLHEDYINGKR